MILYEDGHHADTDKTENERKWKFEIFKFWSSVRTARVHTCWVSRGRGDSVQERYCTVGGHKCWVQSVCVVIRKSISRVMFLYVMTVISVRNKKRLTIDWMRNEKAISTILHLMQLVVSFVCTGKWTYMRKYTYRRRRDHNTEVRVEWWGSGLWK